jgi:hypothetical protein
MIIDNSEVVFTKNIKNDMNTYLSSLSLLKKNGEPYKSVDIDEAFYFKGTLVTKVEAKKTVKYFTNNSISVKLSEIKGERDIKLGGKLYKNVTIKDDSLVIGDDEIGDSVSITDATVDPIVSQYITRNNGEVLKPLLNKYYNIVNKTKTNRIVGYADINSYMKIAKEYIPVRDIPVGSSAKQLKYNTMDKSVNIYEDNDVIEISGLSIESETGKTKSIPYVLITLKPSGVDTRNLPFKAVKYKNMLIFITPIQVSDTKIFNKYKGSLNLLS